MCVCDEGLQKFGAEHSRISCLWYILCTHGGSYVYEYMDGFLCISRVHGPVATYDVRGAVCTCVGSSTRASASVCCVWPMTMLHALASGAQATRLYGNGD